MSMALKQGRINAAARRGLSVAPNGAGPGRTVLSRAVRQDFRGDPGLFSSIGKFFGGAAKFAGGFIPGPIGGALTAAGGILAGNRPVGRPVSVAAVSTTSFQEKFPGQIGPIDLDIFGAGQKGASISFLNGGGGTNGEDVAGLKCLSGFHPNKASYFLKDGTFIAKGSQCVRNRRMNPLNPRAASTAIKRIGRGKAATGALDRVSIKCKKCFLVNCTCPGNKVC